MCQAALLALGLRLLTQLPQFGVCRDVKSAGDVPVFVEIGQTGAA